MPPFNVAEGISKIISANRISPISKDNAHTCTRSLKRKRSFIKASLDRAIIRKVI